MIFDDDLIERLSPELEVEPDGLEERHLALPSCLLRLSSKDRELPHHRYATTASLQQYATATSRSAGTLKAILFNLRAALKLCIERRLQGATLQLLQGQARISPNSGASALIEGPSTLTLIARCETADSGDLA